MPTDVKKMSATTFTMQLLTSEKTMIEVTLTGSGLKYDSATGAIKTGEIFDISLANYSINGKRATLLDTQKYSGLNTPAEKLAEMIGDGFWNQVKIMADVFDKLGHLHDAISYSFFSPSKNYTTATDYGDFVVGFKYSETIEGLGGDDDLYGGSGNDSVFGGKGDDYLNGDNGNDLLFDIDGNNNFSGGSGNDLMRGGAGVDVLNGGAGNDVIYSGGGVDTATGGSGVDRFVFNPKEAGRLMITDFTAADVLVNLTTGSADEAYKDFMEFARQNGRHVSYDHGEIHLVLRNVKLSMLEVDNFSDGGFLESSGLL